MKSIVFTVMLIATTMTSLSQVNCYIYPEGSPERQACELCDEAIKHPQGSKASQLLFDKAIAIGPKFAWSYYEKSVPYFKRGFLLKGLEILNEAIRLKPLDYLCYRAYWYWQYRNYKLCIQDLEAYYNMPKAFIQFTPGGEKDMRIILGLAYAKTGDLKKGIETIKKCINSYNSEDDFGFADYHSLGVLYVKDKQYDNGINTLEKQLLINEDIADTYYYLGLAHLRKNNKVKALKYFEKGLMKLKDEGRYRNTNAGYFVYSSDFEEAIINLKSD